MPEPTPIRSRQRMPVAERRRQIAAEAAALVSRYGSYGVSMQTVADAVGLTLPGLHHHVRSRDELLTLIIETYDDGYSDRADLTERLRGIATAEDGTVRLPLALRRIVDRNADRPAMVALFLRLAVEAHDPDHPAHHYYRRRHHDLLTALADLPWHLPARLRDPDTFTDLLRTALCAMDGCEVQSLTDPAESLADLWSRAERTLFGAPEWDGYR